MENKFDRLYEEVLKQYRIDEGFGIWFKSQAYYWFLYTIEFYLGNKYSKEQRNKALNRIRINIIKHNKRGAKLISDYIADEFKIKLNENDIIKVFDNIIKGRINLYNVHKEVGNNLAKEFNNEKYEKIKSQIGRAHV